MQGRIFKDLMYDGISKLLKALANPQRLEIIEMLSQGEKSVEGIVQTTGLSIANASQHLQVLKNNNLVKHRKEGHYVYYSLVNDETLSLYQYITQYAINQVAELERILIRQRTDNNSRDAVTLEELETMLSNDNVLLLDARPKEEFEHGHIPGAVCLPANELIPFLKNHAKEKEIIAYCRGPFCVLADETVKALQEQGFKVRRLDEGYPEWKTRKNSQLQTMNKK